MKGKNYNLCFTDIFFSGLPLIRSLSFYEMFFICFLLRSLLAFFCYPIFRERDLGIRQRKRPEKAIGLNANFITYSVNLKGFSFYSGCFLFSFIYFWGFAYNKWIGARTHERDEKPKEWPVNITHEAANRSRTWLLHFIVYTFIEIVWANIIHKEGFVALRFPCLWWLKPWRSNILIIQ